MERSNPLVLIIGLLAMLLVWGGAGWLQDGLYIAKHEGDAVHLLDILLRMENGQVPHLDFLTPIGSMSFHPIVWLMGPDTGAGRAMVLSQIVILLALLPAVFWVGISRLSTVQALCFGLVITVLMTAFVHGEPEPTLSVSMHYNRWAWALAFLAIALSILPADKYRIPVLDGAIIGSAFGFLVLIKVTYVLGFAVPVLIALVARREWTALIVSVVSGLIVLGVYTFAFGFGYWAAYVQDILAVMTSEVRSSPSHPLSGVIGAPAYLGASLILLAAVILLRQSREAIGGLVLLFLVPGFFYVTYQNFGNDPQWLYLLAILLFALRPRTEIRNALGWDMRRATTFAGVIAMALAAPSFFNLAYSPFRHAVVDKEGYSPLLTGSTKNADVYAPTSRAFSIRHDFDVLAEDALFADYASYIEEPTEDLVIFDEAMPRCQLGTGYVAYFDKVAKELSAAGYEGENVLQADVFSTVHWLYGDFPALKKGAPWSYGTEAGLGTADYLLIPLCPLSEHWRQLIFKSVTRHPEVTLTEAHRNDYFVLFRITKA